MKISLESLELLDAIEVRGSFSAAAVALHRVPSAVTHAIRRLEEDLGVTLFERQGRRSVMTAAGRTLLEEGRYLLQAAGDLECRVQRVATGWENEFRIAVEGAIDIVRLLPLIAEFDHQGSGTRLRFSHEVLGGCWDALASGRADLAIGAGGDPPPGGGFAMQSLGQIEFVFAVAPSHPLASHPEPLPMREISRYRGAVVADTSRQLLARSAGLLAGQQTLTVPHMAAKRAVQVAGLGVGHLPRPMAEAETAAGRLVIKKTEAGSPAAPIYVVWRTHQEGRALDWFRNALARPEVQQQLLW